MYRAHATLRRLYGFRSLTPNPKAPPPDINTHVQGVVGPVIIYFIYFNLKKFDQFWCIRELLVLMRRILEDNDGEDLRNSRYVNGIWITEDWFSSGLLTEHILGPGFTA
jgi:hypothetical protein